MPAPSAPSDRDNPATAAVSPAHVRVQGGFTLLELLVVIAVLGVLAGVAVLAVGALRGTSQEVACDTDAGVIATAQDAYAIEAGRPGSEAELVAAGYLAGESQYHDVLVGTDSYDLVAVGGCASAGQPTTLSSGKRILNAAEGGSRLQLAPAWPPFLVPCGMLTRDTGDANQNPMPCGEGRLTRIPDDGLRRNPDGGLRRLDPGDGERLKPATGDKSCGPNRICDADMAPESEPGG